MSSEAPPTYDVSIFIPSYWADQTSSGFDKTYADNHYLKFPIGQGTEYIPDLVVSGTTTLGSTSASSLNMGGGNITNVTNINGSAYPPAAGINAVLATGNTAVDKNMIISSSISNQTSTLSKTGLIIANSSADCSISNTVVSIATNTATPSINKTEVYSNSIDLIGSSVSISNKLTPISSIIADGTYTATLLSNALNLITNAGSTLRNAISNTGMTLTGSTTSILNTISAASNTLTDGTRTIFTGMISSVATIKLNAASSGGNSVIINPTTIGLYTTDGTTTTDRTELTRNQISVVGSGAAISSTLTPLNGLVVLNSGGGSRVEATQIYISGSGGVSTALKRDASTSVAAISTNLNAAFTPNTTIGASILLQNADTSAGLTGGNPIIYERTKTTTAVGDVIGSHHYWMKDAGGTRKEYARTTAVVKDATTGSIDSSLDFQVATNGTLASMLELNGAENQINALKPLDMNNNSVNTSTGDLTLDASTSGTSTATLIMNLKEPVVTGTGSGATSTGGIKLNGTNITSGTSGGNSGLHLIVNINGTAYKIALQNV